MIIGYFGSTINSARRQPLRKSSARHFGPTTTYDSMTTLDGNLWLGNALMGGQLLVGRYFGSTTTYDLTMTLEDNLDDNLDDNLGVVEGMGKEVGKEIGRAHV